MADPVMDYNPVTGKHRIRLVDGDPVLSESPEYAMLSMWYEGAGWAGEETPRRGTLSEEFPETTLTTPFRLKASLEERCQPLVEARVIESVTVISVTQPSDSAIAFTAEYRQGGRPPEAIPFMVGT